MACVLLGVRPPISPVMRTPSVTGAAASLPLTRLPEAGMSVTVAPLAMGTTGAGVGGGGGALGFEGAVGAVLQAVNAEATAMMSAQCRRMADMRFLLGR
ncbi:hypothetical protein GCM10027159_24320 [Lysobacter terrae]